MDANQASSLPPLIIQNTSDLNELRVKLKEIIRIGPLYQYEASSCLMTLLKSTDQKIVTLSVEAVAELVKCEEKRKTLSHEDIIKPIVALISRDIVPERLDLIKHCCRAIGNLCCDNDTARTLVDKCKGVSGLKYVIEKSDFYKSTLRVVACKALLNFAIGGQVFCESIVKEGLVPLLHNIIKVDADTPDLEDELVITVLLVLTVLNDNQSEFVFEREVLLSVVDLLRETTNIKVSELCLELLHSQAEDDSVKLLLAKQGGIELVSSRLEDLVASHEAGGLAADDEDVETLIKLASDLIVLVLTGEESMVELWEEGRGAVYSRARRWLLGPRLQLAGVLALGNFARTDQHCTRLMHDGVFDQLLDIFATYHEYAKQLQADPEVKLPVESATVPKVEHGVLSSVRNLLVSAENKRAAARGGRAASLLLAALPDVADPHVAYKLLAALRMLVDGQESVAHALCSSRRALAAAARWRGGGGGAGGEAPRLLAWAARAQRGAGPRADLLQVEGCVASLVSMLVSSYTVMQNEAILALTLLAIEAITERSTPPPPSFDLETSYIDQLVDSEIGKHIVVLIDGNCAKMPVEVAENLLAFLEITSKKNKIAADYKAAKVQLSLQKFVDSRQDFSRDLRACARSVVAAIDNIQHPDKSEQSCPQK